MTAIKPLVVSMGEPAGIGPDVILKAWDQRAELELPFFYVVGAVTCFHERAKALGLSVPLTSIQDGVETAALFQDSLPVIDIGPIGAVEPGVLFSGNGRFVIEAIHRSVDMVAKGMASGLVTAPIHKAGLYETGFSFPGHTEFLGALAQDLYEGEGRPRSPVMMLASDELKVVPLTVHVALKDVPGLLSQELIVETVETLVGDLHHRFGLQRPRVALTGLNPHAGEDGKMGREEIDVIIPALETLTSRGFNVVGPVSADTCFYKEARQQYDAVVAMYHDQALIPIKTLAFDEGVNVTLGLPFIRTSPDHGTALDIAGTGAANPLSFVCALRMAAKMARTELA